MQTSITTLLATIAKQHLHIETLEIRNSDSLDFHDVAVWGVKDALLAAYEAGKAAGKTKPNYENSKHKIIVDMLQRPEGATIAQLVQATDWKEHSVRGAISTVLKMKWKLDISCTRSTGKDPIYRIDADALMVPPAPGRPAKTTKGA
ncbi:MAG: hypothetical protein DI582_11055 [Azospirillum brasilense]|nr:MAG: hypothetical protein DI582_11055 [Azospirillum brasilense]